MRLKLHCCNSDDVVVLFLPCKNCRKHSEWRRLTAVVCLRQLASRTYFSSSSSILFVSFQLRFKTIESIRFLIFVLFFHFYLGCFFGCRRCLFYVCVNCTREAPLMCVNVLNVPKPFCCQFCRVDRRRRHIVWSFGHSSTVVNRFRHRRDARANTNK